MPWKVRAENFIIVYLCSSGDSGGPLFGKAPVDGQLRQYIMGIVSYGEGCGEPNKPG